MTNNAVSKDEQNFKQWFPAVLRRLYWDNNAGFVIALATFPLLERYLRRKVGIADGVTLGQSGRYDNFCDEFVDLFHSEMRSRDDAGPIWDIYRNGLLHLVTFKTRTKEGLSFGGFRGGATAPIEIDPDDTVWINPVKFAERVIVVIETDFQSGFPTFPTGTPLPTVEHSLHNLYERDGCTISIIRAGFSSTTDAVSRGTLWQQRADRRMLVSLCRH